jgi:hypothetical protein
MPSASRVELPRTDVSVVVDLDVDFDLNGDGVRGPKG